MTDNTADQVKCPYCAEPIQREAIKCKHCGEWLTQRTATPPRQIPPRSPTLLEASESGETGAKSDGRKWAKAETEKRLAQAAVLLATVMLLLTLARWWPYGYWRLLRWVVCASAVYIAWWGWATKRLWMAWVWGIVAVTFNPILPIHMPHSMWEGRQLDLYTYLGDDWFAPVTDRRNVLFERPFVLNIIAAGLFVAAAFVLRKHKPESSEHGDTEAQSDGKKTDKQKAWSWVVAIWTILGVVLWVLSGLFFVLWLFADYPLEPFVQFVPLACALHYMCTSIHTVRNTDIMATRIWKLAWTLFVFVVLLFLSMLLGSQSH